MDEADIRYYLNHANVHFQSQGFTALAAVVVNERNEKRRKEFFTLLFDCLCGKSLNLAEWAGTLIHSLKNNEEYSEALRLENSTVVDEVLSRLDSAQHKPLLIELMFKVVHGGHSDDTQLANEVIKLVLRISPKIGSASSMIAPLLKRLPVHILLPVAVRLLYTAPHSGVDACLRRSLLAHCIKSTSDNKLLEKLVDITLNSPLMDDELLECFPVDSHLRARVTLRNRSQYACLSDLHSIDLTGEEFLFDIISLLATSGSDVSRQIASNVTLQPHPSLMLPLLSQFATTGELLRSVVPVASTADAAQLKELLTKVQKLDISVLQVASKKVKTLADYFRWTVSKETRTSELVKTWKNFASQRSSEAYTPSLFTSLAFLSGLYRFVSDDDFDQLLETLASYSGYPELQNQLGLFFMTLFSQSTTEGRKKSVIRTLPKIAKNTVVTKQILKLLYALSKSGLKDVVFEVAGDLWEANQWVLDETEMQCLTNIDYSNDVEEMVQSKFSLLRRICETEYGERFLSSIVEVVDAGEDWSLPNAIRCLSSLCKQNLLEVGHTKSRVEKVVRQTKGADVLVAYCELLATSTVDNDDFNVALKCSEELWRLKEHEEEEVKVAAWKALAQFSQSHLTQRVLQPSADLAEEEQNKPITGQQVCQLLEGISSSSVLEGFGMFLHRMVACELEDLSRGFYHHDSRKDEGKRSEAEHTAADPVLAVLIPTLRSTLESVGNELHALALMEPLTKSVQPLTKKSSRCTQIYQSALLKSLPPNDLACTPTLTYMAVWQTGTEAVINAMLVARRKQNPNFSITVVRDQVVDMMRSAMDQLTQATANVIAALPFLCRLVSVNLKQESSNTADTTHAHWQVSILEYLLLHAIDDYQPRTLPLFQKEIARTPITRRLALLSAALILNRFTISFVQDMPELVHLAVEYLESTNDFAADAEWIGPMVRSLLRPCTDTSKPDDGLAKITRALVTGDDANVTDADFDLIRGRNTLNLLATVLAVDATTVENIADEMRVDFSVEERVFSMKQTENTDLWVDEMFDLFGRLDEKQQDKLAYTFAKNVEKSMKSANVAAAEAATGLASYYVSHRSGTASARLPVYYGQLPETSILRATVDQIKEAQDVNRLRVLLQSLVPQQRKDGRHLPPMDWTVVYNIPQLQQDVDSVKTMFYLALQQCHTKVVTKIVGRGLMDGHFLEAPMTSLIPKVAELLPQQSLRSFVLRVLADIEKQDWPDTATDTTLAIARLAESKPEIFDAINSRAPPISSFTSLQHPFYRHFGSLSGFGLVSLPERPLLYQLWNEVRKGAQCDLTRLFEVLAAIRGQDTDSSSQGVSAFLVLVKYLGPLDSKDRIEMCSSLAAQLRIRKSSTSGFDESATRALVDIFRALVVSTPQANVVPLCIRGEDELEAFMMVQQRFPDIFATFVRYYATIEAALKTVAVCLLELCTVAGAKDYDQSELRGCLRLCVNSDPSLCPLVESYNLWFSLFV